MNPYEMTFIVRPDLDDDATRAVIDGVTGRLESAGAEIIATYAWMPPRRRLAFPIRDFGDGFYVTTTFRLSVEGLADVENWLKLNTNVVRYLLVRATDLAIRHSQQRAHQAQQPQPQPQPAPASDPTVAATPDGQEQVETQPAEPAESATPAPAGQTGVAPEPVAAAPAAETREEE